MNKLCIVTLQNMTNEDLDLYVNRLENPKSNGVLYSPTTQWSLGNSIIEREGIIIKKNSQNNNYCIPVFEYGDQVWGLLESDNYLRTGIMYFIAKKCGLICEK
jgi:hypothetical protein